MEFLFEQKFKLKKNMLDFSDTSKSVIMCDKM